MKNVYLAEKIYVVKDDLCCFYDYLNHVRKYGGVEIRLIVYMEYLIISVMVQAKSRRGNPMDS